MNDKTLNQIYDLIGKHLGYSIVDSYKNFYRDKTDELILTSIEGLLIELIGPKATKEELSDIKR